MWAENGASTRAAARVAHGAMNRTHSILVACACVGLLLTVPGWALRHERRAALAQLNASYADELRAANEQALQNEETADRIRQLQQGSLALERRVRDELGYVRPGEIVVTVHRRETRP